MNSTSRIALRRTAALAALSFAAMAGAQTLNVEAVAQMANMRFIVYDLDPNDTYTASVSYIDDANRWRTLIRADVAYGMEDADWVYRDSVTWANALTGANQTLGNSGTYVSAGSYVIADGLWARGRTFTTNVQSDGYAGLSTTGVSEATTDPAFNNLRLGPGTGLRLTADASVSVKVQEQCADYGCNYGYATADLYARFSDADANGFYSGLHTRTMTASLNREVYASTNSPTFTNAAATQWLTMNFENRGTSTLVGRVRFSAEGFAQAAFTSAVPEPASGTLLLSGVAIVATATRKLARRKS